MRSRVSQIGRAAILAAMMLALAPSLVPLPRDFVAATEPSAGTHAVCTGDGESGYRVQVLYVRPSHVPSRLKDNRNYFRQRVTKADAIYRDSASQNVGDQSGGTRYIRLLHDADCLIIITEVVISPLVGNNVFRDTKERLISKGYDRIDRRYIIFLDARSTNAGACGESFVYSDDRPKSENIQYMVSGHAVIFNNCWQRSDTVAHELAHSLGAVQDTAPHALGEHHCKDGYDVMCYGEIDDGYDIICEDTTDILRLDCNKDDYFNTDPDPGNYLYDHWNIADSPFLGSSLAAISLDKASSKYNGVVTATLSQFAPGKRIYLTFDGTSLGSVVADSAGAAMFQFRTPLAVFGDHTIRARTGDSAHDVQTTLRVIPRVLLNETSGSAGSRIRVYFYGYAAGERVEAQFTTSGSAYTVLATVTIASNGRGTSLITIPSDAAVGSHTIRGKVIGVNRSATTPFQVTAPSESAEPTVTPSPSASPTISPTATASPTALPSTSPTPTWDPSPIASPVVEASPVGAP